MSHMSFREFFAAACGDGRQPYPYQERFAEANPLPAVVGAPTGAGKTATVAIGWLWRRFHSGMPTPRRLVYCLPMRVLVEQSRKEIQNWVKNLGLQEVVSVNALMGGVESDEWYLSPERPAVLIGTQDMLLSRALNRGYAASRFHWPIDFGLLNNDCLWVFDEIQLMGTGLATSTQLQSFRESLGTYAGVQSVWMSATLLPQWLASIDYRHMIEPELKLVSLTLDRKADCEAEGLRERWNARKSISQATLVKTSTRARRNGPSPTEKEIDVVADDTKTFAEFVKAKHKQGSLTLVIVNQVERSRALFQELRKVYAPRRAQRGPKKAPPESATAPDLRLIHSQFRPRERETWWTRPDGRPGWLRQDAASMQQENPLGRIIVSTQVVEAGVDISAQTLITELAPWPSLVQRFGRCNRGGEFKDDRQAEIFWVDVPATDDRKAAPYAKDELDAARERITTLRDVSPRSLSAFFDALSELERRQLFPFDPPHVIRKKDFIDLFDTTPDLAGNDIDVSRFIRDGDDNDVHVFWRAEAPPRRELQAAEARQLLPTRDELCPVKLGTDGGIKKFLESHTAFRWDALASAWVSINAAEVYPGQAYWIPTAEGGYDAQIGWSPSAKWSADLWFRDAERDPDGEATGEPAYSTDLLSQYGWRSIAEHTDDVVGELKPMLDKLAVGDAESTALLLAAFWHDWGKAHEVFQAAIRDDDDGEHKRPGQWPGQRNVAKAAPKKFWRSYQRRHFRHELASALGILALLKSGHGPDSWDDLTPLLQNLALYLIAAHHGKVRLSIRSMPNEKIPDERDALFARGIWQGDELPRVELGDGQISPAVTLDLSPMLLGQVEGRPSWTERMLELRDHCDFGPVKLAYLEALLRAADMRASKVVDDKAKKNTKESA